MSRDAQAAVAQRELEARRRHWPAAVAAGQMPAAEAELDIAAWEAIHQLFAHGVVDTELRWDDLRDRARIAVERRLEAALAAPPAKRPPLEARLGAVAAIRRSLDRAHRAAMFPGHAA